MPLNSVRKFGSTAVLKAPAPLTEDERRYVLSFQKHSGQLLPETELSKNECNKPSFIFTSGGEVGAQMAPSEEPKAHLESM